MRDDCRELAELQSGASEFDEYGQCRAGTSHSSKTSFARMTTAQLAVDACGIACEPSAQRGSLRSRGCAHRYRRPCWRRFRICRSRWWISSTRVSRSPIDSTRPAPILGRFSDSVQLAARSTSKDSVSTASSTAGSSNAGFSSIHSGCCSNWASSARIPRAEAIALRPGVYRPTRAVADLRVCPSLTTSLMRGGHGGPQLRTNRPYWLNPSWSGWPSTSSSTRIDRSGVAFGDDQRLAIRSAKGAIRHALARHLDRAGQDAVRRKDIDGAAPVVRDVEVAVGGERHAVRPGWKGRFRPDFTRPNGSIGVDR